MAVQWLPLSSPKREIPDKAVADMALRREWLLPLTRAIVKHGAIGPAYVLGDQASYLTHEHVLQVLKSKGLLRNSARAITDHLNPKHISLESILGMVGIEGYRDIDMNGRAALALDFSQQLPTPLFGAAATVIDIGTLEHIFDVATAFGNIVRLLKRGGIVILLSPVSWFDHGFLNFNPLIFKEFFSYNGFEILEHKLIVTPLTDNLIDMLAVLRINKKLAGLLASWLARASFTVNDERYSFRLFLSNIAMPAKMMSLFVARKLSDSVSPKIPIQGMYRTEHTASSLETGQHVCLQVR